MLIAIMTFMFLGGSGSSGMLNFIGDTDDAVKEYVTDDDRRKEARATLKTMQKRTKELGKTFGRLVKDIKAQAQDQIFEVSVADSLWDEYHQIDNGYRRDILDLRFELRDQLTREEWALIFPQPED